MRHWSESEDNVGEEKNVEELFIPLQLFSDRLVTIYGIIYWRIQNSAETNIFFLSAWNNHDWYCLQVFSHRLFWVLIVFGGVALAVFLSTSAYLDWQVVFLIFLLATLYLYLFYLSFNICSFVFVLVLLVFTSVILKLNIKIFWISQKVYIITLQADPIITSVKVSQDILYLNYFCLFFQSIIWTHAYFVENVEEFLTSYNSQWGLNIFQTTALPIASLEYPAITICGQGMSTDTLDRFVCDDHIKVRNLLMFGCDKTSLGNIFCSGSYNLKIPPMITFYHRVLEEQFNSWLRENEIDTRSMYKN